MRPPSDLALSWKLCWVWDLSNISQPSLSPSRWARSHPPESHRVKSSNYQCSNVHAIYFVSAGYFLRILENTTSVFSVIAKTDNHNVYNLLILSGNIWGGPLVSNKHSLSDTGMKTDLLKRPEISFMKINFISTWTISPECSGHKHFSFFSLAWLFRCWLILNPWELTGASLTSWQKPSHELNTRLKGQSWHRFWGRKNQAGQTW